MIRPQFIEVNSHSHGGRNLISVDSITRVEPYGKTAIIYFDGKKQFRTEEDYEEIKEKLQPTYGLNAEDEDSVYSGDDVPYQVLGYAADAGHSESQTRLVEDSVTLGIDPTDYNTWRDVAEELINLVHGGDKKKVPKYDIREDEKRKPLNHVEWCDLYADYCRLCALYDKQSPVSFHAFKRIEKQKRRMTK